MQNHFDGKRLLRPSSWWRARRSRDVLSPHGSLAPQWRAANNFVPPTTQARKKGGGGAGFYCVCEAFRYYRDGEAVEISLARKHTLPFKKWYSSHRSHRLRSSKREMYASYNRRWMPAKISAHVLQDFFFLTFLLIIKIWHFSSTVLALSSLRSCIVGEWHPLSFSKLCFMLPTHEMLPLEQAQITLSLYSLRTVFLKIRNQQHISHMVSFIPVSSKFHNLHQCH